MFVICARISGVLRVLRSSDIAVRDVSTSLDMTKDRCREDARCRMTKTFDVCHLRAHFGSFAFFLHLLAVKLTTKNTKDTENFALFFRSAGRVCSGERGLLARGARQLAEHNPPGSVAAVFG
jgi:hypothetical protein